MVTIEERIVLTALDLMSFNPSQTMEETIATKVGEKLKDKFGDNVVRYGIKQTIQIVGGINLIVIAELKEPKTEAEETLELWESLLDIKMS